MSSSSEEENECLKEAVDPTFFSNDLFSSNKSPQETKEAPKLPPSLRHQQQPKSFNPLEIRVTPEFRAHVSKHLNKLLDRLIDYTNETQKTKCKSKHRSKNILLLQKRLSSTKENEEELMMTMTVVMRRGGQGKWQSQQSGFSVVKQQKAGLHALKGN
ncbi:UNVERIFIED_CONTAM: hypothetical protein PYX00_009361 [Menopon gallinae]|uniref:Protein CUSTOS n=1 Tax=Menopon gallinae TaxID=328185 RepID=A0AAW2HB44_9NEOP